MIQVHSNIATLLASNLTRQEAVLEATNERTWLMQLNTTLYRKLAFKSSAAMSTDGDYSAIYTQDYQSITGETMPLTTFQVETNELGIPENGDVDGGVEDAINLIRVCSDAYVHRQDPRASHHQHPAHVPPNTHRSEYQSSGDIEMAVNSHQHHQAVGGGAYVKVKQQQRLQGDDELRKELSALSASLALPVDVHHMNTSSSSSNTAQVKAVESQQPLDDQIRSSSSASCKESDQACVVCYAEEANAVLLDCGHAVLCWSCAQLIAKKVRSQCPVCRLPIEQLLRISSSSTYPLTDGRVVALSDHGFRVVLRSLPRHPPAINTFTAAAAAVPNLTGATTRVQHELGPAPNDNQPPP
jgi:hypothetical protein